MPKTAVIQYRFQQIQQLTRYRPKSHRDRTKSISKITLNLNEHREGEAIPCDVMYLDPEVLLALYNYNELILESEALYPYHLRHE